MKRIGFVLLAALLFVMNLSACGGGQQETEALEKFYGVEYSREEEDVYLPAQFFCGEEYVWLTTAVKNDCLYRMDYELGTLKKVDWQSEEEEYLLSIAENGGVLYICVSDADFGTLRIRSLSEEGQWSELASVAVTEKEWRYQTIGFRMDQSGQIYLFSGSTVICYRPQGEEAYRYDLAGTVCALEENGSGAIECVTLSAKGITLYEIKETEAEEKWSFAVSCQSVFGVRSSEASILCLGVDDKLLFFDRESGGLLAQSDCMQAGISLADISAGSFFAEEETLLLYGANGEEHLNCVLLRAQNGDAVKQRTQLIYGTTWLTSVMEERIIAFNKENEEYYITAKVYDGEEGSTRMMADMVSGNGPDIIDLYAGGSYPDYVAKNCLEDLTGYLEESEYSEDILWQVLKPYRIDGKLCMLVPHFTMSGIAVAPEDTVYMEDWNLDAFLELLERNQGEKGLFVSASEKNTLSILLHGMQSRFVDVEGKKADFENEEFIRLLEICAQYGGASYSEGVEYDEVRAGVLFQSVTILDFSSYLLNTGICGPDYTVYGYPMVNGQTYLINGREDSCGIYSGSEHKDGAWQFLETLLETSYQEKVFIKGGVGLPVRESCWNRQWEASKEEGMWINSEELYITDSEIAMIEEVLYHGDFTANLVKYSIMDVVDEETAAYFAGDKTAEEVAHIIQSRVQIMLEE